MKQLLSLILFGMVVWSVAFVWAGEEEKAHERAERPSATENVDQASIENQREGNEAQANAERELFELEQKLEDYRSFYDKMVRVLAANHPRMLETEAKIRDLENLIAERLQGQRKLEESKRNIEHLRAAAKLLEEADMPEMARELRRRADDLEQELNPRPDQSEGQGALRQFAEQLRELKEEVQKLQDEMAIIRERLQRAK